MKHLVIKITILLFVVFISNVSAQIQKVEIVATGLTCSLCSNAIYKQLQSINEVEKIEVDLNKNMFIVTLKNENTLTPKIFKDKVEKAGFFVGSMVLYINIDKLPISENKQSAEYIVVEKSSETLNKIVAAQVLDKGYLTAKEYKKIRKEYSKHPSFLNENENDFHLKILS